MKSLTFLRCATINILKLSPLLLKVIGMEVDWKVDAEALNVGWKELNSVPTTVSARMKNLGVIVDIGGGSGGFGNRARASHPDARIFCIDLEPRVILDEVTYITGSGLDLPFKDSSVDLVTVHAMLHHVPNELEKAFGEIDRVLKKDGCLIIQEPLDGNPFANMARQGITTTHHDEDEVPLAYDELYGKVKKRFAKVEVGHYFITYYLMPHVIPRLPAPFKKMARWLSRLLFQLDTKMLANMPKTRKWAAYVNIVATR